MCVLCAMDMSMLKRQLIATVRCERIRVGIVALIILLDVATQCSAQSYSSFLVACSTPNADASIPKTTMHA